MSTSVYIAVFVVMVVGSTVQASVGFGQGLVTAPLLRLLHPELLPGPIVIAGFFVSCMVIVRNSRWGDVDELKPALAGRVVGIGAALVLLASLSDRGLTIVIGAMVLAFVFARLFGVRIERTPAALGIVGAASGVSGTIAALGGAPMALVYAQHSEARDFRGPMGIYQAVGSLLTLIALVAANKMGWHEARLGLLLLPPIIVGSIAARWVTPVVDRGYLAPIVLGLSATSALVLLVGELW